MAKPLFQTEKVINPEVEAEVKDLFEYHKWTEKMTEAGTAVRDALMAAVLVIIKNVPPGNSRNLALGHLIDARMKANAAISHGGRY